jgi:hypothetical protein
MRFIIQNIVILSNKKPGAVFSSTTPGATGSSISEPPQQNSLEDKTV